MSIEHVDHIVDLRRSLVMVDSRLPAETETMLRDVERASNPWGKPQTERAAWAEGLGVRVLEPGDPPPDVLYWVGCAASFDERARTSAESTAKLLLAAGLDVAILGPRESCTGDPARRAGNEYVFQAFAEQNVSTLNEAGVTKIVASCPHCFNTLANEYPDFGGRYEVTHHSELLADLVERGKLRRRPATSRSPTTTPATSRATTTSSRRRATSSPRSAGRSRWPAAASGRSAAAPAARTCGWRSAAAQINEDRVREAAATGAETLAVACPFCTVMLDDGVRQTGSDLRVADVSTLLVEALERANAAVEATTRRRTSADAIRLRSSRLQGSLARRVSALADSRFAQ